MPGTTEHVTKFILENVSGKKCGVDFGLAYNPEFIALGSVIHNFLNPDFILIGETNKRDGRILEEMYKKICENDPPVARMSLINAKIAKISLNCYLTMKISFAITINIRWLAMHFLYLRYLYGTKSRLYTVKFLKELSSRKK